MSQRSRRILLTLVVIGAGGLLLAVWALPSPDPVAVPASTGSPQLKVNWLPGAISEELPAGEGKVIRVDFAATQSATNLTVRVVPELRPYIQVSPSEYESVIAGQQYTLTLTVTTTPFSLPRTMTGTIHLQQTTAPSQTFANPLPVTLNIIWRVLQDSTLGISMLHPPALTPVSSIDESVREVGLYEPEARERGIGPLVVVTVDDLNPGQMLTDWIVSFGGNPAETETVELWQLEFVKWFEAGPESHGLSYSTVANGRVITISTPSPSFATSPAFLELVSSLTL